MANDPKTGRKLVTIYLNGEPHEVDHLNANDLVTHCAAQGWSREAVKTVVAEVMTTPVVAGNGKKKKPETAAVVEGEGKAVEEPAAPTAEEIDAMDRETLEALAASTGISDVSEFSDDELRQAVKIEKGL